MTFVISIHTFLTEGDVRPAIACDSRAISIHTFLTEGDPRLCNMGNVLIWFQSTPSLRKVTCIVPPQLLLCRFQSTPSLRKVTRSLQWTIDHLWISIHTFLTEGDPLQCVGLQLCLYFNPHLPYGRWRNVVCKRAWREAFQSTPSLRKVTFLYLLTAVNRVISIHTFLTEGDTSAAANLS